MITHLACVMDGNRRWAKQQGFMSWQGHQAGARTVEIVIKFCLQYKIRYLSLYTFSLENFNRSLEERSYLFDMIVEQTKKSFDLFIHGNIEAICCHS
jgi:undecaprenyl diphosphate synthase